MKLVADGAQLVDTRDQADFAGAHVRGAVNISLGGSYATWCGTVLDPAQPVVLIAAWEAASPEPEDAVAT